MLFCGTFIFATMIYKRALIAIALMGASAMSWSQEFVLGEFDEGWFEDRSFDERDLFLYLRDHFEGSAMKIIKYAPYPNDANPCKYGLSVSGGVYLQVEDGCDEESGYNATLYLPGDASIEALKTWLEKWHTHLETGENKWQGDNYIPADEGAGCYYEIGEDDFGRISVEIYCGC